MKRVSVVSVHQPVYKASVYKAHCALGIGGAVSPLHAQSAGESSVSTLNTVVVTASGFEQDIVDAPASITVIPREKLEKGAYRDLTDALRDVPGIIMTPSDNNTSDISLRGMGANYTLILVDGKRMSTRETQTNGSTGTDQNIITRTVPKEWGGSIRLDSTLQSHSRSGNLYQGNFYLACPIKEYLLGLSLYGVYSHRGEDEAPSSTLIDFGGSYNVNKQVTMYAGVYNALDKRVTYDDYGYVEDGRRYWLGMNVKF